ncbi:hypothetical protein DEO72_LG11g1775 [Vigna unguiculata]|uniref:Uncharacterized protein n=1 Tax=Vigna unguiculata TaxID=3917 RepID=A0A4D6NQH1_VIGUN|nr:hypothetical protein DEO72_LG11g1775 [Vigna unguiculata]
MHLIIAVIPKQVQAQENKYATPHHAVSSKPLAQAEGSRSGETCSLRRAPPRLGESTKKTRAWQHGISLNALGRANPLNGARSKVERAARATFRAKNLGELLVSSRLGEIDSLGRDLQVSSLFFTVTAMKTNQTTHASHFHTSKQQIQS